MVGHSVVRCVGLKKANHVMFTKAIAMRYIVLVNYKRHEGGEVELLITHYIHYLI